MSDYNIKILLVMEIVDMSADVRQTDATVRDKFKWEWLESKDDNRVYYSM